VRDEDGPRAFVDAAADDAEQAVAGIEVERRRGLIEDQQSRVPQQRSRDRAGLAVAELQVADQCIERRRRDEQLPEDGFRPLAPRSLPRRDAEPMVRRGSSQSCGSASASTSGRSASPA